MPPRGRSGVEDRDEERTEPPARAPASRSTFPAAPTRTHRPPAVSVGGPVRRALSCASRCRGSGGLIPDGCRGTAGWGRWPPSGSWSGQSPWWWAPPPRSPPAPAAISPSPPSNGAHGSLSKALASTTPPPWFVGRRHGALSSRSVARRAGSRTPPGPVGRDGGSTGSPEVHPDVLGWVMPGGRGAAFTNGKRG